MQEDKQQNLWINIYSLKSRISLNVLMIIFILFLFLTYTVNRLHFYVESAKETGNNIEESEYESMALFNQMEQTNQILQNQLINQINDNNATRRKIWSEKIIPSLNLLNELQSKWLSSELKLKLATIEMNLKKLRKDQDAIEELFDREIENQYFQESNTQNASTRLSAKSVYNRNLAPLINQLHRLFEDFSELRKDEYKQQRMELESRISFFWIYVSLLSILVILVIAIGAWSVASRLDNRFKELREYTRALSQGNFYKDIYLPKDEAYSVVSHIQELNHHLEKIQEIANNVKTGHLDQKIEVFGNEGQLGQALSQMQDDLKNVAKRDFQRNWTNEGIALFGNLLRQYSDAQSLYDLLVANLVRYLEANQGGIFILDDRTERKPFLELKSIYAYERKRFTDKQIQSGQGLVGQAWKEKDSIYIEQTSEDYLKISSGLGGAQPRSVLIVPMINNDLKVLGVLELASFKMFKEYEIDFVKRVAEMIVSAISSIKNNEINRLLLADAQRITNEMRHKEELMQSNFAKLIDIQQEMHRNQAELHAQTKAINATLATLTLDTEGKIIEMNEIFMDALHYEHEDLIGQSYEILLPSSEINKPAYFEFWESLKNGETQVYQPRFINKNKDSVWLNAAYTPIKDHTKKVIKVIMIALNITEQFLDSLRYQSQLQAIHNSNAVIEFDTHGFILDVNDIYLRMLGYKRDELIGKHHSIILPEDERESDEFITFWDKLSRGEFVQGRFCRLHRNGKEIWIWGSFNIILDYEGKPQSIINIAQDITKEVNIEQDIRKTFEVLKIQQAELQEDYQKLINQEQERLQLIEQKKQLQTQIENQNQALLGHLNAINTTVATLELDMEGNITHANDIFLKSLKYKLSEIKGLHYTMLEKRSDLDKAKLAEFWDKLKEGIPQTQNIRNLTKENEEVWFYATYTPIKDYQEMPYKIIKLALPIPKKELNKIYTS